MTEVIVDQQERDKALTPEQSFIIQAPAGSGKTGLLIQRYLKLLSLVDAPEEIIAITFTRKAAAEMQGRILNALESVATESKPETNHELTTYALAEAALKRDKQKSWNIIDNPGRLRIQTIDSLCASLTRQMPLLAKLGTQPETVEDASALYKQAAINTLAELESGEGWSDSIANLVYHLDNDLPRIKNLIVDMLGKRDQWLAYVVHEHNRADMERSVANLIEEQLIVATKLFPNEYKDELITLLQFSARHLSGTDPDNPVTSCFNIETLPAATKNDIKQWQGIAELLLTKTGGWRKQVTVKNGFPAASENKLEEDERRQRKQQVLALITELQKVDGLQDCLTTVSQLPPATYTDAEWQIVNALCNLLKLAAAQLRLIFAERHQMDFIGVAESAVTALGEEDAPTDLAMTLNYHIKHLLIDEYQDISVSQYRLLQRLTREWSMDDGRSLFLVGDPMQSIYRFREAEVGLFIKTFHEQCLGNIPLESLKLKVNFRSQQAVVDWVNESFSSILPGNDDVTTGAVSFSNAEAFDKMGTSNNVVIYPLYGKAHVKEAQHTVEIIQNIKQSNSDDRIAILVRSRSHLNDIVPELRKADIDFTAIDIEGLATQACIQDLLVLTRAYLFSSDRVAWLACLRAPWCGVKITTLYQLCDQNRSKTVWQCINDKKLIQKFDTDEKKRLESFVNIFAKILDNKQRHPMRWTIESLWCQLGGPATLNNETDLENCESFFCLLESLDKGGTIDDIQDLIEQVGQLYAAPASTTGSPIQIMTIHKAKGLEFDHVILPGLGRSPRSDQGDLLVWLLRQGKQEQELILAPIREAGNFQAPLYDYINSVDKAKQSFEDGRLLYVATTRTRKTLHLIGHAGLKENKEGLVCEPQKRSLLAHLWPQVNNVYEQHLPAQLDDRESESYALVNQETHRLVDNWNMPEPPASVSSILNLKDDAEDERSLIEFEWAGETIKHVGSVVHNAIQWIAEEGIEHWNKDRINAEQQTFAIALQQIGVPGHERDEAVSRVQRALSNMLDDERGQWILSNQHKQQHNEFAISGLFNENLVNVILDRTFVDVQGARWIIDYKTSRHEGANIDQFLDHEQERYRVQLEKYGALMQQLGEQQIKLGLYFPLLQGWREWTYE